jgi:hypothetical protein
MRIVNLGLGLALAGLLLGGNAVFAEEGDHHACKADVEALCKGVQRGGGRIMKCLHENDSKVSAGCKQAMTEAHEKFEKNHPCAQDAQKFCKDMKPGDGRVGKCLKEHEADLSPACKVAAGKAHEDRGDKK